MCSTLLPHAGRWEFNQRRDQEAPKEGAPRDAPFDQREWARNCMGLSDFFVRAPRGDGGGASLL